MNIYISQFLESGIQEWVRWAVLAQGLSWGDGQNVGQSHNHLKTWLGLVGPRLRCIAHMSGQLILILGRKSVSHHVSLFSQEASVWTKLVEVMEFQLSYFKSWKMMLWKCCTQYARKFGKLSSGHRTGKGQFSLQSQRKAMPKNAQTTA